MQSKTQNQKRVLRIEHSLVVFAQSFNRLLYYIPLADNLDVSCFPDRWGIISNQGVLHEGTVPVTKQDEKGLLEGFQNLTYRYLLRDCIESFALSLDDLYATLQVYEKKSPSNLDEEDRKKAESFARAGIYRKKEGKLQRLKKDFGLKLPEDYRSIISGLKDIRDCLSHSAGIVMPHHGNKVSQSDEREFSWLSLHAHAIGKMSGKRYEIEVGDEFPEPVTLQVEPRPHAKTFKIGHHLIFSPGEAFDIANSLNLVLEQYIDEAYRSIQPSHKK
ncbi:MAG: hypothetical protein QF692_01820 [Alphaproteobacteria bacterium]|jgi:hypothetical protein|nr:hypothetical protein [Alphaproteobacteria bacterium]MDP7221981.1 hypothetical protein [Alphaproteobacteria bacterium]